MSFGLPRDVFEDTEGSDALAGAALGNARFFAGAAGAALKSKRDREEALAYANAYEEERRRQRKAQKPSGIGGIAGFLSPVVGAFNPVAGALLGAAGKVIG